MGEGAGDAAADRDVSEASVSVKAVVGASDGMAAEHAAIPKTALTATAAARCR